MNATWMKLNATRKCAVAALATLVCFAAAPQLAQAGGRHRSRVDADIDDLDADLVRDRGGWRLMVEYEVEIEDARRGERFDLVLTLTERGRPVLDRRHRPWTIVVPLNRPVRVKRDEVTFKRRISVRLGHRSFHNPKKLKIHAEVVRVSDGRVLDDDSESVDYRRGYRLPRWSAVERPFVPEAEPWRDVATMDLLDADLFGADLIDADALDLLDAGVLEELGIGPRWAR